MKTKNVKNKKIYIFSIESYVSKTLLYSNFSPQLISTYLFFLYITLQYISNKSRFLFT